MSMFQKFTCFDASDRNSHALSFGATEYAVESDDPGTGSARLSIAHKLRRMEEAEVHDGQPVPELMELRQRVNVPDDEPGEYKALYLLRAEVDRMIAVG